MATASMTFGTIPDRDTFDAAFERECAVKVGYTVPTMAVRLNDRDTATLSRCAGLGPDSAVLEHGPWPNVDGEWTARDTFAVVCDLVTLWERGDDAAGDLASTILTTLRFEWI